MKSWLDPEVLGTFLREDLGKRTRHFQGLPADALTRVFSRRALDELLWGSGSLLRDDGYLIDAGTRWDFPRKVGGELRDWVRDGYVGGATFVLNRLQRRVPAVAELARQTELDFDVDVDVTLLLTPPGSRGFPLHADAVDAFVLQLEGEKHWQLHTRLAASPAAYQEVDASNAGPCEREVRLRPGEILYLPRGVPHRAHTESEPSLHLTIGLYELRWVDWLQDLVEGAARRDVELRRRADPVSLPRLAARFHEAARMAATSSQAALVRRRRRVAGTEPLPGGALREPPAAFDADASFAKAFGTRCHVQEVAGAAVLEFSGRRTARVHAPRYVGPAFRYVANVEGAFRLTDLPDVLGFEEKCTLLRRLVAEECLELLPSC